MSACYIVILQDDFDWAYTNRTKEASFNLICEEFAKIDLPKPTKLAEWSGRMVLDLDKTYPGKNVCNILLNYSDSAMAYTDESPWAIIHLRKS